MPNADYCTLSIENNVCIAKKWASKCFEFMPKIRERCMIKDLKHIKNFLCPPRERSLMRIREGPAISVYDCYDYPEFKSLKRVKSTFPKNLENIGLVGAERLAP